MDAMNTPVWRLSPDVQQPLGPYSTAQVQTMFSNGQLSETVGVWREGMAEWTPVQQLFSQVWWYASPDQQQRWGPFSIAQTQAMLADNQISTSYYAWMEGMPQWKQLEQVFSQGSQVMDTVDAPVWWVTIDGQQTWGPYSAAQLNTMLTNNQTSPSVYVRRDGDSEWAPLQQLISPNQQNLASPNSPPNAQGPAASGSSPQELELRERELDLREAELGETRKLREENRRMRSEELRRRGQEYENRCWEQHMKLQRELGREQAKSFGIMGGSNRCHRCDNYTCTCH